MVYNTAYTYHNYNSPFLPENKKKKKKNLNHINLKLLFLSKLMQFIFKIKTNILVLIKVGIN
jgi:hypothetical protein